MIRFKVSVPYNLSLFGEFAVKYGKSGLMTGIDLRTTLAFSVLSEHIIQLKFPQINLSLSIPLEQFLEFYRDCESDMKQLCKHVLQFITSNSHFYNTENHKIIVHIFFYLLVCMIHDEKFEITSFCVELSTQLMMDTGFSYYTPSTVCFAACFLHWSRLQNDAHYILNNSDSISIRSYAAKCEEITSKIDLAGVTVCTFGSIIQHKSTDHCNSVSWVANIPNETILLVDSKYTPNLDFKMQQLEDLINIHPVAAYSIFIKIDYATKMASDIFKRLEALYTNETTNITHRLEILLEHNLLITYIDMNQRLLQLLNMSHYHLDEICKTAQKHGMYGKYTDIGNGRYAYIWCQSDVSKSRITFLSQDLIAQRFDVIETSMARCGVKIEHYKN